MKYPSRLVWRSGLTRHFRLVRNLLVRKVPGFKSAGHSLVVTAYVTINLAVTFTNMETVSVANLAHRLGWYV